MKTQHKKQSESLPSPRACASGEQPSQRIKERKKERKKDTPSGFIGVAVPLSARSNYLRTSDLHRSGFTAYLKTDKKSRENT